ncbi:MAG: YfhO family protein [Chloroflexota bacterium]
MDTPNDGVLVLSELDYPGWRATVDGKNQTIWRADAGLRALPLRAGDHQIIFTYRPLSVTIGGILSAVCALALLLIGVGPAPLRRGSRRPAVEER